MEGDIEEPLSIGFQADSLHSGSVSFGRFESEELSWERRSSFSHNKYLEEVEKCSKPGSVIEKKAYFEAHFKKKGILLPSSFEGQNGREYQTNESDTFENGCHGAEFDNLNERCDFAYFDEGTLEHMDHREYDNGIGGQFDYVINDSHYAQFDEGPECSHGECQVTESEMGKHSDLFSKSHMEADVANGSVGIVEYVNSVEAPQTETLCDDLRLGNNRLEKERGEGFNENAAVKDTTSRLADPSPKRGMPGKVDKVNASRQRYHSPKLRSAMASISTKPRLTKSQVSPSQIHKSTNSDASKSSAKNQNGRERDDTQRAKTGSQSPHIAAPNRRSLRTPKKDELESCKSKVNLGNKCEKEPRLKKVVESQPSGLKKLEHKTRQSTNRIKQVAGSTKPEVSPSAIGFSFKSSERAERRKEFYMKLEEKMHAKEAEMNQIQARTQVKAEAEIKQFRKSLNFKATPMPSFYQVAMQPGSDGNKVVLSKAKPIKVRQKPSSPASESAARLQVFSETGNDQALSITEFMKTNVPESTGEIKCSTIEYSEACQTEQTNNNSLPEAASDIPGVSGKDREKTKDANMQRQQVSENCKASKDHRNEGKPKVGNRRSSGVQTVRKSMKGVRVGSNSGMGHLAVGVAS